jgi:hypothetical protein
VDDTQTAILIGALDRVPEAERGLPSDELAAVLLRLHEAIAPRQIQRADAARAMSAPSAQPMIVRQPSPEQIARPVRRWDWPIAIATFVVTIFAFVLTVYDDDFGAWEDYAKAFTAGLLGQVGGAALWNLFPALRSYRLPVPKVAK